MTARAVWTYADYAAMPDDGRRYELWDGELSLMPAPGLSHQGIVRNLLVVLHDHVRRTGLGVVFPSPVDCILADTTVLQPDMVFVANDQRAARSRGRRRWSSRSSRRRRAGRTAR